MDNANADIINISIAHRIIAFALLLPFQAVAIFIQIVYRSVLPPGMFHNALFVLLAPYSPTDIAQLPVIKVL